MGARLRLKASVKEPRASARAIQARSSARCRSTASSSPTTAADMYITGTFDTRWNNDILNPAFRALTASDFDVIQLGWRRRSGDAVRDARVRRPRSTSRRAARSSCWSGQASRVLSDYVIEVGSAPGLSNLLVASLGPTTTISRPSRRRAATTRASAPAMRADWDRRRTRLSSRSDELKFAGRVVRLVAPSPTCEAHFCPATSRLATADPYQPIARPSFRGSDPPIKTPVLGSIKIP